MATLSVTIPDNKVTRVRTAFGHYAPNGSWVIASVSDVQDWILGQVKDRVKDYEGRAAAATIEDELRTWA